MLYILVEYKHLIMVMFERQRFVMEDERIILKYELTSVTQYGNLKKVGPTNNE